MHNPSSKEQTNAVTPSASTAGRVIRDACCFFTALCAFLLLLNVTIWQTNGIPPMRYLLLLPLSLCLSAARNGRLSQLSRGARYTLHPLFVLGGFYLFGFLPYQIQSHARAATVLVVMILAALVYGLAVGIFALTHHAKEQKKTKDTPYESQFGGR